MTTNDGLVAGNCPDCDEGFMHWHSEQFTEPHGESGWEEWYECDRCGYTER